MKNMKKVFCLMLAMVLVLGMGITVMAAEPEPERDTYTISVREGDDHTYAVYQIFIGVYGTRESDTKYLSNIAWGKNGKLPESQTQPNEGEQVAAQILFELESASGSDPALLETIEKYVNLESEAYTTASSGSPAEVPAGYYLIKDSSTEIGNGDSDAYTLYIVQIAGDVTIKRKSGTPKLEKKVQENSTGIYQDFADYNIGDDVPFELIGSLPENYDIYKSYKYVFHDTLSGEFTYNKDSVQVYTATVNQDGSIGELTDANLITDNYYNVEALETKEKEIELTKISVTFEDLKKVIPQYNENISVVVRYTARLNENAIIGNPGNPNEVYLEFSNNPNSGGEGDTGTTPPDKVVVFTYELDGTKSDGMDKTIKLAGAEFKLYRLNADKTTKEWVQVKDSKVSGWTTDETAAFVLTSDNNGLFKVIGLDADTYYLREIKAPAGYNLLESDIKLEVTAKITTGNGDTILEELSAKVTIGDDTNENVSSGAIAISVENNKGTTLPKTGGIGTTVFYVLGSILVIGCSVILIVRKRMGKKD